MSAAVQTTAAAAEQEVSTEDSGRMTLAAGCSAIAASTGSLCVHAGIVVARGVS
jgi:hypothetical protein